MRVSKLLPKDYLNNAGKTTITSEACESLVATFQTWIGRISIGQPWR
jgi:hypothetical protein